jgi:hypothetical protein
VRWKKLVLRAWREGRRNQACAGFETGPSWKGASAVKKAGAFAFSPLWQDRIEQMSPL